MRSGDLLVAFEADAGFDDVLLMVFELKYDGFFWSRCGAFFLTRAWQSHGDAMPAGSSFGGAPDLSVRTVETGTCFKWLSGAFGHMVQSGAIPMDIPRHFKSGPSVDGHTRTCTSEEQNVSSDVQWLHRW